MMEIAKGGDLYSYISDSEGSDSFKSKFIQEKGEIAIKFILAGVVLGL